MDIQSSFEIEQEQGASKNITLRYVQTIDGHRHNACISLASIDELPKLQQAISDFLAQAKASQTNVDTVICLTVEADVLDGITVSAVKYDDKVVKYFYSKQAAEQYVQWLKWQSIAEVNKSIANTAKHKAVVLAHEICTIDGKREFCTYAYDTRIIGRDGINKCLTEAAYELRKYIHEPLANK